jgi:ATP-dependent DNA helicase RecG
MVMEYLRTEAEITNSIARELTGIKSENSMKQVFYRLRESGQLEQSKVPGKKPTWRKPVVESKNDDEPQFDFGEE